MVLNVHRRFVWLLWGSQEMITCMRYVCVTYICISVYYIYLYVLFLAIPFSFNFLLLTLVSMCQTEWSMVPACPILMCFFNWRSIDWTVSSKNCV